MSSMGEVSLTMRVMINKEKTKVLFALVDSDLADILLSFLTLPLGTIVRLLNKHYADEEPMNIGSLTTLYKGLLNLDNKYFSTEVGKDMLIYPRKLYNDECHRLKINIDDTPPAKMFICETVKCPYEKSSVRIYHDTARCVCGKQINNEVQRVSSTLTDDGLIFTNKKSSFLISDDLQIVPNMSRSFLQCAAYLGIEETRGAEERIVAVGYNEVIDLLKRSLLSLTPLTDLVLKKKPTPKLVLHPHIKKDHKACRTKRKMILKLVVQISTNKLLFAQAQEDFVDFLMSMLTIPLGQVENLLGSNTSLGSMDTLYTSIRNLNNDTHLKISQAKCLLLNPTIAPKYLSKYRIFPLTEEECQVSLRGTTKPTTDEVIPSKDYNDPKGEGSYVRGKAMFMVTDDLTITPLCMFSCFSSLNRKNIPISDTKEMKFHVGYDEALGILKASLTSRLALTDGLNLNFMKQPKQKILRYGISWPKKLIEQVNRLGLSYYKHNPR